jgi:hypothetical protein
MSPGVGGTPCLLITDISGQHFFGKQSLSSDVVGEAVSGDTLRNSVSGQS